MKTVQYYLMRHADYYNRENEFIRYSGMQGLKKSMSDFLNDFNANFSNKKLRIIHSELLRARHTALLIGEMLPDIRKLKTGDSLLNSDRLKISTQYIQNKVSVCEEEKEVCLILSHQPDIEFFCQKKLYNSQWLRLSIEIEEEVKKEDSSDDLPF